MIWGVGLVVGVLWSIDYEYRLGETGNAPNRWPSDSGIEPDSSRPTLLIFLHPLCPCSRSSVSAFIQIVDRLGNQVTARVVFLEPPDGTAVWSKSDYERILEEVPGIKIEHDPGGGKASAFGVKTSGHVLVYDPARGLIFSGGVTSSKGMGGENPSQNHLIQSMQGEEPRERLAPGIVFGCPLESLSN